MKFSLKRKASLLIVCIVVLSSALSYLCMSRATRDIIRQEYIEASGDLAATLALTLDAESVRRLRNATMEIYAATEEKVDSSRWGEPAFEAYLENFAVIEETEDFQNLRALLRRILVKNHVQDLYLIAVDPAEKNCVYLVDATEDDPCPPGCIDPLEPANYAVLDDPAVGFPPYISNTEYYGWLTVTGQPIVCDDGSVAAYAFVDVDMNAVMEQQQRFMLIFAAIILACIGLLCLISILLVDRFLVTPINKLSEASVQYCSEASEEKPKGFSSLNIRTGDEIETLANSMCRMEQDINRQMEMLRNKTRELMNTREQAAEMDRAANIDALTRVRNKRAFDKECVRLQNECVSAGVPFGLAMIDMNNLKTFNDNYGHEKGDIAIKNLSQLICKLFQHSPVFRIGGDEFVVVLEGSDLTQVEYLVEQFRQNVEALQQNRLCPAWERVSAAIGYAVFNPSIDEDVAMVFSRADENMYQCKKEMKSGRERGGAEIVS